MPSPRAATAMRLKVVVHEAEGGGSARRLAPREREERVDELHDEVVGVVGCHSTTLS